ncbi:MAG: 2-iminobutanoate/2-iminopropanoate deaminase [candidate division WS2 bacterium]|uniref:2-iminobutanoate/2-iminopropanoate deaminase n=1 Tax=Psychracetigena formicireducens TaxID=2986056 RepID=A0A9E2BI30_PSYF1|nr:2-iminobutanoate/2-iminopropanoate deaminase [Candidatus Psychracetigena formicireducens]MBT9145937.1 2-iminobutanoate/2-iminopropanoate deaminase [Candidatus Psychracetigena formicireducens]
MKKLLKSSKAPKAIGPYSPAIEVEGFKKIIFLSGQIPLDPETGEMVGVDIKEQAKRVLLNIQALLEEINLSLENVVKNTVFLTNLQDFSDFNEVYKEFFKEIYPARTTIEVKGLPRGSLIEIESIAVEF